MGAVLRGSDVDLGRDLAIKVLLEKFANRPDAAALVSGGRCRLPGQFGRT